MSKWRGPSRLGLKFLAVAALALAAALALQTLLYDTALPGLLQSPAFENHWYEQYGNAGEDFQRYVRTKNLTMQEAQRDTAWTRQHPQVELYLEDPAGLDTGSLESYGGQVIACADGLLYAYPMPNYFYYDGACRILSLLCASLCFFLILIPYTALLIRRITILSRDMQVLAGGDLSYQVTSRGRDELAELGRSIEEMRLAVLEQMKRENEAVRANSRLITSLSHDLRTPLTKLMGYLEILRHGKFQDEEQRAEYLRRASDKALQMRTLSDEMFRHFQVGEAPAPEEGWERLSGPVFLGQLLAEESFDLTDAGFSVEPAVTEGAYCLYLRTEDICRVFDNLFSNLKKYADPHHPIRLSVREEGEEVAIELENRAGKAPRGDSRGIGLPTIRALLDRNGGRMEIVRRGENYHTTVWLPKAADTETERSE
mgnify:FL=1